LCPTPETIPLTLPDSRNPRYSYGGSKIISELIAFNYARDYCRKAQAFRPHNVYGPDMGWKHVVPHLIVGALKAREASLGGMAPFEIQGDGTETRAFCYVDDIVGGILAMCPDLSCDLMAAPAAERGCVDSAAMNPAASSSSHRRALRVARVVVLAPLVVAVGMLLPRSGAPRNVPISPIFPISAASTI
jgi:hypothetical protein